MAFFLIIYVFRFYLKMIITTGGHAATASKLLSTTAITLYAEVKELNKAETDTSVTYSCRPLPDTLVPQKRKRART